ncbi:MAG: SRPBCC family protein [Chitinophagaceae bacterium]|jgi:ligand-binding SRPBCC domain-containing protein|nr:SRPBCC family protein [Chitinophagaceae bacterium]
MPKIHITSFFKAPVDRVFDLSRNLALRKKSLHVGKEQLLSSSGDSLVHAGETITLRAKHLGKSREITARITELNQPLRFTEEQVKGDLKSYRHEYHFKATDNGTILIDILEFEGPRDLLGSLASTFFLKSYLESMLRKKNELLKQYAETEKWKAVLT